jgi:Fe-S-cluster containining protein
MLRMEITLDLDLLRALIRQERAQTSHDIVALGIQTALSRSLSRQDERIAAAPDVGTLACRAGCDWCCHFTVDVRPAEVFGILSHMENALPLAEQDRLRAQISHNSRLIRSMSEEERISLNLPCPFLSHGHCQVYPARPQSCRNYHATDAAGCRQSYEEPENLDIDPEFASGVYQVGNAHVEAFNSALGETGVDVLAYELNCALAAAFEDPKSCERFEAGALPFLGLDGEEVVPEFDDLM